ncbi:MAG TPA: hypothetical protein VED01_16145 [Burkholderiales bacterium]|nr:hypothetical protein [Burkholderiales bacterium]
MAIDLNQRQFLAQAITLSLVRFEVDRARENERIVEAIELLLNRLHLALDVLELASNRPLALVPNLQDRLLQQPHVARRRL